MRSKSGTFFIVLSMVLLSLPFLLAPADALGSSYTVYGSIENQFGVDVQGATVVVTNNETDENITVDTNSLGHYQANLGNMLSGWSVGDLVWVNVTFDVFSNSTSFVVAGAREQVDLTIEFDALIAVMSYDQDIVFVDDLLTFSAEASYSDNNITDWTWDFGDGSTDSGEIVIHAYDDDGVYEVNLTITDEVNVTVTQLVNVTVLELYWTGPNSFDVTAGVDLWVDIEDYIPTDATVSTDDLKAVFVASNNTLLLSYPAGSSTTLITLLVGKNNVFVEKTIGVVVEDPVTELVVVISGDVNWTTLEVTLTASITGGISPYFIIWDWDDNTTSSSTTHIYDVMGNYTVTVTISDDQESEATDTHAIVVDTTLVVDNGTDNGTEEGNGLGATLLESGGSNTISTISNFLVEFVLFLFMGLVFYMLLQWAYNDTEDVRMVVIAAFVSLLISLLYGWREFFSLLFSVMTG